jgi:glycosyltransferase involved in cell wall biosynthesis
MLNVKDVAGMKAEFGNTFKYKRYQSIQRHKPFRIKKKYNLWHSLNQNIKIEPFFKTPYVLTVHDIHFVTEGTAVLKEKLREKFEAKLKRATAIIYISEFSKKDTNAHFKVPNVPEYVIYNGNTITSISIPDSFKTGKKIPEKFLFSIGEFTKRKNFKSLVAMLKFLPEYSLVLAGNNSSIYADQLAELAEELGLKDRVIQTGKIGDDEKKLYLSKCAAFVFPSHREGFGIPPIEAMRFGKPVFISNNTSLPEIGGENSFYWDHYEPQYMAATLKNGMEKFEEQKDFYTNWYIERAKSFNWDTTAKEYIKVYQAILS